MRGRRALNEHPLPPPGNMEAHALSRYFPQCGFHRHHTCDHLARFVRRKQLVRHAATSGWLCSPVCCGVTLCANVGSLMISWPAPSTRASPGWMGRWRSLRRPGPSTPAACRYGSVHRSDGARLLFAHVQFALEWDLVCTECRHRCEGDLVCWPEWVVDGLACRFWCVRWRGGGSHGSLDGKCVKGSCWEVSE